LSDTTLIFDKATRAAEPHPAALKVARAAEKLTPLKDCTPAEARQMRTERGNPYAPAACDLAAIEPLQIDIGTAVLAATLYKPQSQSDGPQPVLLYFHGGGYVLGDIDGYDTLTQQLAALSGCHVIAVDYRRAPEVKSVTIFAEAFATLQWVHRHSATLGIDPQRIAIGGDSAGGNLTIAVALSCKEQGFPQPALQLLIYPATDYTMSYPSIEEFATGYLLTKDNMCWFREHFLEHPDRATDPLVSPLRADLEGLAPAFVLTAGFDPLRDEGYAFAQRLQEQGVPVEHVCYRDMIHAFISFAGGIPAGMTALTELGTVLRRALVN